MSKTLIALAAALLLAGAVLLGLRYREGASGVESYPDRAFAVDDVDEIGEIFLADMRGRTLSLKPRGDGRWLVNDSLLASSTILEQVLNVLEEVEVDFIPPAATAATVLEAMRTNALKIVVADRRGEVMRTLLLGPSTQDERNSYLLVEGQRQPYAVRVPGHTGSLRPLFDLRSVDAWRSLDFVALDPGNIVSARVEYPRQPGAGFVASRGPEGLKLRPADPLVPEAPGEPNARRLESYLEGFADVSLFARVPSAREADSLRAAEPHARITLALADGDSTRLRLYPRYMTDGRGRLRVDEPVPSYFVDRDGRELARVQTQQLQQWLRGYASFF